MEKKPDKKAEADKELIEPELEEVESRFPALSRVLSAAEDDTEDNPNSVELT